MFAKEFIQIEQKMLQKEQKMFAVKIASNWTESRELKWQNHCFHGHMEKVQIWTSAVAAAPIILYSSVVPLKISDCINNINLKYWIWRKLWSKSTCSSPAFPQNWMFWYKLFLRKGYPFFWHHPISK